jgi:hypothetical protein
MSRLNGGCGANGSCVELVQPSSELPNRGGELSYLVAECFGCLLVNIVEAGEVRVVLSL